MAYALQRELNAMRTAFEAMRLLDEGGRRRAVMWLAGVLDVNMSEYDPVIAREAAESAQANAATT